MICSRIIWTWTQVFFCNHFLSSWGNSWCLEWLWFCYRWIQLHHPMEGILLHRAWSESRSSILMLNNLSAHSFGFIKLSYGNSLFYPVFSVCLVQEMPKQQARGDINSYMVTMTLTNGSVSVINGPVYTYAKNCGLDMIRKEPSNLVSHAQQSYPRCSQEQEQSCFHYCHLTVPVKEVMCIAVTANAAGGKSSPALVALPQTGESLQMEEMWG